MKKALKKITASLIVILLTILSGLITVTFSPQMLFAKKIEHQAFTIYSNTDFDETHLVSRLDDAYALIKHSELHDEDYHFDVLLAHNHFFNKIEDLQGKGVIARATAGYITLKVPIDPKNNHVQGSVGKINLTYLLAHEMIHNLQANKYGLLNFSPLKHPPFWKLEGYPEYIARRNQLHANDYSLRSEIQRYVELMKASNNMFVEVTEGHFVPFYYYKGRLMVEYLMDIKGMTYDEILKDDTSEEVVFQEVLQWTKIS
ncbi:hypothetical protein [Tunicatimonas pelagia]|uniref:hypothetical protein n=1 Tax=Tunicatimonas pelagia TaxID=931531 RepID=UPI0026651D74|nr:hypothetical protein [Tunicatimonas pelagia]WKN40815.1 hypothetical protein P0M28_17400 [Tunicatimonas pelagia]